MLGLGGIGKVIFIVGITIVIIAIVWPLKNYFHNKRSREEKEKSKDNEEDK